MRKNIKKFLFFWLIIGLLGLLISLILSAVNPNLYSILFSFLLVFPFIFISSFLILYIGYQIPKWATKFKDLKSKIMGIAITCYILVSLIGLIPVIVTLIVVGVQNIPMSSNGNVWPFNAIALILFYILYNLLNTGFLLFIYKPKKSKKRNEIKE